MDVVRALHRLAAAGRRVQRCCVPLPRTFTSGYAGDKRWTAGPARCLYRRNPPHGSTICRHTQSDTSQATLASVAPVFSVMKFDKEGNILSFGKCQST
ncbi:hypothetical protein GDO78_012708 [Eleutherodactylus coqui]|uniref:Uncharacterized protein n=1 Tax=Eleutherodactylus coqui TaxID=57060 RepID=A0A8J6F265_ELECQ|nr:hypothetical protein GDO78_012708 [Eleutherodactylus coqui]